MASDHGCRVVAAGWWCSRTPGHEGPCAARPVSRTPNPELEELLDRLERAARVSDKEARVVQSGIRSELVALYSRLESEAERRFQSMMEAHKANAGLAVLLAEKDEELSRLRDTEVGLRHRIGMLERSVELLSRSASPGDQK